MNDKKEFISQGEVAVLAPSGDVVQAARSIVVSDAVGEATAARFLGGIKAVLKKIETKRKEYVAPLNDVVKAINEDAKDASAPFAEAERIAKNRLADYAIEVDRIAREERMAKEAEQRRLVMEAVVAPAEKQVEIAAKMEAVEAAPVKQETKGVAGVSYRMVWKWMVTKEAEIPREYLVVDNAKVTAAVRCGVREIPGINIYEDKTVAVR